MISESGAQFNTGSSTFYTKEKSIEAFERRPCESQEHVLQIVSIRCEDGRIGEHCV